MDRTKIRRLWNVQTMKVEMYRDIRDEVEDNGYVCVSHVWGDQRLYPASQFGITGVDWDIPLSDPNKILRLKNAVQQHGKKYCWFDVLCMPQNKQDKINLEIPYMGEYYSGADMTFVLSDLKHVISEDFFTNMHTIIDVIEGRYLKDLSSVSYDISDMSKERWFDRVWTLQEAVLSKKITLVDVNGLCIDLSEVAKIISHVRSCYGNTDGLVFYIPRQLADLGDAIKKYKNKTYDLVDVLSQSINRECFKPQDKFYGVLGILGYRDFDVDYEIDMDELNREIARYAYSKGDISWISVSDTVFPGIVQPMFGIFSRIGESFRENIPGISGIKFSNNTISMKAAPYAIVTAHEYMRAEDCKNPREIFGKMGFAEQDFLTLVLEYDPNLILCVETLMKISLDDNYAEQPENRAEIVKSVKALGKAEAFEENAGGFTIIKATTSLDENFLLFSKGKVDIGDQIMLLNIHDVNHRCLGIVVSEGKRKGIFLYKKVQLPHEFYIPHIFLL